MTMDSSVVPPHLSEFVQYVNGESEMEQNDNDNDEVIEEETIKDNEQEEGLESELEQQQQHQHQQPPSSPRAPLILPDTLSLTSIPPSLIVGPTQQQQTLSTINKIESLCSQIGTYSQNLSDAHGQLGLLLEELAKTSPSPNIIPSASYQQLTAVQQRYIGDKTRNEIKDKLNNLKTGYQIDYQELKKSFDLQYKSAVSSLKESEIINTQLRRGKIRNLVQYRNSLETVSDMVREIDTICSNHYVQSAERLQSLIEDIGDVFNNLMEDEIEMHRRLSKEL